MKKPAAPLSVIERMFTRSVLIESIESDINIALRLIVDGRKSPVSAAQLAPIETLAERACRERNHDSSGQDSESYLGAVRRLASHIHHEASQRITVRSALEAIALAPDEKKYHSLWARSHKAAEAHNWPSLYGSPLQEIHAEIRRARFAADLHHPLRSAIEHLCAARCASTWIAAAGYAGVNHDTWREEQRPLLVRSLPTWPPQQVEAARIHRLKLVDQLMIRDAKNAAIEEQLSTDDALTKIEMQYDLPKLREGDSPKQHDYARQVRARAVLTGADPLTFARLTSPSSVIRLGTKRHTS